MAMAKCHWLSAPLKVVALKDEWPGFFVLLKEDVKLLFCISLFAVPKVGLTGLAAAVSVCRLTQSHGSNLKVETHHHEFLHCPLPLTSTHTDIMTNTVLCASNLCTLPQFLWQK